MRISAKGAAAALTAVAAGAVVAGVLLPGTALGGARAPSPATGIGPSPALSIAGSAAVPLAVPANATPPPLTLEVATNNRYGPILVTPAGMTVYRPNGGCACDPGYLPLLTKPGQPLRLPILVSGTLGTIKLDDGTLQVTFDGWPLFTFSGDHAQGDANGVAVHWRVIQTGP